MEINELIELIEIIELIQLIQLIHFERDEKCAARFGQILPGSLRAKFGQIEPRLSEGPKFLNYRGSIWPNFAGQLPGKIWPNRAALRMR